MTYKRSVLNTFKSETSCLVLLLYTRDKIRNWRKNSANKKKWTLELKCNQNEFEQKTKIRACAKRMFPILWEQRSKKSLLILNGYDNDLTPTRKGQDVVGSILINITNWCQTGSSWLLKDLSKAFAMQFSTVISSGSSYAETEEKFMKDIDLKIESKK